MSIRILRLSVALALFIIPARSFAWGAKGHGLVAEIAFHFLEDSTKAKVKKYLGGLSIEEAASWMDNNRSNSYFDFEKPWHYLDMDPGVEYVPSTEKNILTVLHAAIVELQKNFATMKKKDITHDLYYIFHLVGDIHQPLHTGYASDRGGNDVNISSQNFTSNLHSAWDTQIIESEGITLEKCLQYYNDNYTPEKTDSTRRINVLFWMKQSRSYLTAIYDFKDGTLNPAYVQQNVLVIENQLVRGGLRLAAVLESIFKNVSINK